MSLILESYSNLAGGVKTNKSGRFHVLDTVQHLSPALGHINLHKTSPEPRRHENSLAVFGMKTLRHVFGLGPNRPIGSQATVKKHASTHKHIVKKGPSPESHSSTSSSDEASSANHPCAGRQGKTQTRRATTRNPRAPSRPLRELYILDQLSELSDAIENNTRATLSRHNQLLRLVERLRTKVELGYISESSESSLPSTRGWSPPPAAAEGPDQQSGDNSKIRPNAETLLNTTQSPLNTQEVPKFPSGFPQATGPPAQALAALFVPQDNQLRPGDSRAPHELPGVSEDF